MQIDRLYSHVVRKGEGVVPYPSYEKARSMSLSKSVCYVAPGATTWYIRTHIKNRRPEEELLALLEEMREQGLAPDSYTFVGVLKGLVGENRFVRARQLLEDAKQDLDGFGLSSVYSAVISGCGAKARCDISRLREPCHSIVSCGQFALDRCRHQVIYSPYLCGDRGRLRLLLLLMM